MKLLWPIAFMLLIFLLSSIPAESHYQDRWLLMSSIPPSLQNALHVPMFGLLQYLWMKALAAPHRGTFTVVAASGLLSVGYGMLDELYQTFVPGRYASLRDVLFDVLGVIAGTAAFLIFSQRRARQPERIDAP